MDPNEHMRRIAKIIFLVFLCNNSPPQYQVLRNYNYNPAVARGAQLNRINAPFSHVSIQYNTNNIEMDNLRDNMCAGALVAPAVVLTVTSCVEDRHPNHLRVVLGMGADSGTSGNVYDVTHIYRRIGDQMAILMLSRDVPSNVPTIRLPVQSYPSMQYEPLRIGTANATQLPLTMCNRQLMSLERLPNNNCGCIHIQETSILVVGAPLLTMDNVLVGLQMSAVDDSFDSTALYMPVVHTQMPWVRQQTGDGTNQNGAFWGIVGYLVFTVYTFRCGGHTVGGKCRTEAS